ncbi:SSU ribosomal protein S20p [Liberibacter crescens BT-1]|uniref:Small ribosomal subunit protein bS20 n=1 Tax=Liberibacter crescens (strain BT-1) TaxID=1215343 RepID=L0EX02_LIBCB|nr:30S ribosomal protein S20 [Liberibacter crescens]AGA65183.1 SSU ribosomal protein S20p [Liberibacter crescens BT-1]AMC13140.1 30S ribosomal protein S20 [Liberibacter crescens]
MANTVSARKMVRKISRRTLINKSRRSSVRSFIRRVHEALESGNVDAAKEAFRVAESHIQKAKSKGVLHKSTASRTVSRLAKRIKNVSMAS